MWNEATTRDGHPCTFIGATSRCPVRSLEALGTSVKYDLELAILEGDAYYTTIFVVV